MDGEQGPKANSDARALFEKGHALDHRSPPAPVGLAQTLITSVLNNRAPENQRSAFLDRAVALLQRVIALDWRNVGGHFLRGELARARGDYEQAIAAYEYTMGLHPQVSTAWRR